MRRYRRANISSEALALVLGSGEHTGYFVETDHAAPADVRIINCGMDMGMSHIRVILESEAFDEVPDGEIIPLIEFRALPIDLYHAQNA